MLLARSTRLSLFDGQARACEKSSRVMRVRALQTEGTDALSKLHALGIVVSQQTTQRTPDMTLASVEDMLGFLQGQGLQAQDIEVMLLRCPRLFSFSTQRQAAPVVEWLAEFGFDQEQVAATIRRFPHLLGYSLKGHLVPHTHYLKSLGVSEEELPQLILARPHVLGTSIELVITYLRKWLRIERTNVGKLLWSYPLDYSLPRLVLPHQVAITDSWDESDDPATTANDDTAAAGHAAAAAAAGAVAGTTAAQPQEPQERRSQHPLGSPDRCSWLELPSQGNQGQPQGEDEGQQGSGGSEGGPNSSTPPSSA